MKAYYPVFLNMSRRRCVVVGGGDVALRKVASLLDCGALVTVISPVICPEITELVTEGRVIVISRPLEPGDLSGAFLAIAATDDPAANRLVAREAERLEVPVNVVDDAERSSFIVPAVVRRGDITVAISTSGASPALARKIRTRLEAELGEEYASLAKLVNEVRTGLKRAGVKVAPDAWQDALNIDEMIELIRRGEGGEAKARLTASLKSAVKK